MRGFDGASWFPWAREISPRGDDEQNSEVNEESFVSVGQPLHDGLDKANARRVTHERYKGGFLTHASERCQASIFEGTSF